MGQHPLSDFVSTTDNGAAFLAIENEILQTIQAQITTNNWACRSSFSASSACNCLKA